MGPEGADPALLQAAGNFFAALHRGDAAQAARLCHTPFQLEAETLEGQQEILRRFREILAELPASGPPLYGVEVLPGGEMVKRHGAPPSRLGTLDLEDSWVAVANAGGVAWVAVFRRVGNAWRAVAYTD